MFATTTGWAKPGNGGPAIGKRVKERLLELRSEVLRYEVGLDDAQAKKVLKVLKKFDPQREALHKKKRAAKHAAKRLFKANSNDQAAYARIMDDMLATGAEHLAMQKRQRAALNGLLSPKQQLQLFRSMKQIMKRLKRKMREFKNIGPKGRRGHRRPHHRRGGGDDAFAPPGPGARGFAHPAPAGVDDLDTDDGFF